MSPASRVQWAPSEYYDNEQLTVQFGVDDQYFYRRESDFFHGEEIRLMLFRASRALPDEWEQVVDCLTFNARDYDQSDNPKHLPAYHVTLAQLLQDPIAFIIKEQL